MCMFHWWGTLQALSKVIQLDLTLLWNLDADIVSYKVTTLF